MKNNKENFHNINSQKNSVWAMGKEISAIIVVEKGLMLIEDTLRICSVYSYLVHEFNYQLIDLFSTNSFSLIKNPQIFSAQFLNCFPRNEKKSINFQTNIQYFPFHFSLSGNDSKIENINANQSKKIIIQI